VVYRIYKDRWYLRWLLNNKEPLPPSIKALRGIFNVQDFHLEVKKIVRTWIRSPKWVGINHRATYQAEVWRATMTLVANLGVFWLL
jgi:hypothetical protein